MTISVTGSDFAATQEKLGDIFSKTLDNSDNLIATIVNYSDRLGANEFSIKVPVLTAGGAEIVAEGGNYADDDSGLTKKTLEVGEEVGGVISFTISSLAGKTEEEADSLAQSLVSAKAVNSKIILNKKVIDSIEAGIAAEGTVAVGDPLTKITEAKILEAVEYLDNVGAPLTGRYLLLKSSDYNDLLQIPAFVMNTYNTAAERDSATGRILGQIHGFNVRKVTGDTGVSLAKPLAYNENVLMYADKKVIMTPGVSTNSTKKNVVLAKPFGVSDLMTEWAVQINVA